jgi:uncharacterized membrane protein YoaK (UPF0700 family)
MLAWLRHPPLPAIFGFTIGCVFGAALEAAAGLWSSALPAALALIALATGSAAGRPADLFYRHLPEFTDL